MDIAAFIVFFYLVIGVGGAVSLMGVTKMGRWSFLTFIRTMTQSWSMVPKFIYLVVGWLPLLVKMHRAK